MAYRSRGRSAPSRRRRSSTARTYRASSPRKRTATRKYASRGARRTAGVGRTLRIEVVTTNSSPMARPDLIGVKPELVRHRTRSQF